jgi:hypothetical protein
VIEGNRRHEAHRRISETGVSELTDQSNEICFLTERARQRFIECGQRKTVLACQRDKVVVRHLVRTRHQIRSKDSIRATQIIRNKAMATVG